MNVSNIMSIANMSKNDQDVLVDLVAQADDLNKKIDRAVYKRNKTQRKLDDYSRALHDVNDEISRLMDK